jgi:mono/diheme cytochrome c family protein
MKSCLRFLIPVALLLAIVTTAYGGGWATVTVDHLPDYAVAGQPLRVTFLVRQHGMTLLDNLKPAISASTSRGLKASAPVTPTGNKGEYAASLTLPQAGDWKITIANGFDATSVTMPLLKVIPAGSPAPPDFAEGTRGGRLFAAKGCIGCHRHVEINPERTTDVKFDLTGKRYPHEDLKRFLKDPSIKGVEMPNLNLKQAEIEALAAFINKTQKKTR